MAKLNRETIHSLAKLCRIECSQEKEEDLLKDLKKIVDYVEQLQKIDTEGVAPCDHVLEGMTNVFREDVVADLLPREEYLSNAPLHSGGFIRVPQVIKKGK